MSLRLLMCVSILICICVFVCASSATCICMCGTADQNRALTVAGLLLADACLEELMATRPVNHLVCPPAFHSHGLVSSKSGWVLSVSEFLFGCVKLWGAASFSSDVRLSYRFGFRTRDQWRGSEEKLSQPSLWNLTEYV